MKTSELTGAALDWAVAKCEGIYFENLEDFEMYAGDYSTDWSQGGSIIEREEIGIKRRLPCMKGEEWEAMGSLSAKGAGCRYTVGPTPLTAAMRCYVASKLGDNIDIPEELTK